LGAMCVVENQCFILAVSLCQAAKKFRWQRLMRIVV
jgi:hypothetical protein